MGSARIRLRPRVTGMRGVVARPGWKSITEAREGWKNWAAKRGKDGEEGRLIGKDSLSAICEAKEGNRR